MKTQWILVFLCLTLGWVRCLEPPSPASCGEKNVQLSVELYYESLCPDSLNFVVDQVKPAVKALGNCIDYHLIPWGNAKAANILGQSPAIVLYETGVYANGSSELSKKAFEGGDKRPSNHIINIVLYIASAIFQIVNGSVECQHGEAECLGNTLHACSFSKLNGNLRRVEFITCYFEAILAEAGNIANVSHSSKEHVISATKKCANAFNLDWKHLTACGKGALGAGRHLVYGEITSELNPPIKWVPMTLVYEPERTNESASTKFLGQLCEKLKKRGIICEEK